MGKSLDGVEHSIFSTGRCVEGMALGWLKLATQGYHQTVLRRLLGKFPWSLRPVRGARCFLAGPYGWLQEGLPFSRCTPAAVLKSLAEAFAAATVCGWLPTPGSNPSCDSWTRQQGWGPIGQQHGVLMNRRGRCDKCLRSIPSMQRKWCKWYNKCSGWHTNGDQWWRFAWITQRWFVQLTQLSHGG